jgi:hypothetical protein
MLFERIIIMKTFDKKNAIYKYVDEEIQFDFYTSLPTSKKMEFVNNVSYLLIGDNYNVVLKNLLFDLFVVNIFTNVDISDIINSDTFIDDAEDFLDETNIVEIVKANAEIGVMDELERAIDLNIEYRTGIHRNIISESIANLINTFENKVGSFNVNADEMMGMMDVLSGLSNELTMDNLLDAYARSDMYKANRENVIEEDLDFDLED